MPRCPGCGTALSFREADGDACPMCKQALKQRELAPPPPVVLANSAPAPALPQGAERAGGKTQPAAGGKTQPAAGAKASGVAYCLFVLCVWLVQMPMARGF